MQSPKQKAKYSKKMVTGISIAIIMFTIAVLVVYWHTGSEPSSLIVAFFGAALGEFWQLAGIKKAEIRHNVTSADSTEGESTP